MDAESVLTHLQSLLATAAHADTVVRVVDGHGHELPGGTFACHRAILTQASFFAALTHSQWAAPASGSQREANDSPSASSPSGSEQVIAPSPEGGSRLSRAAADGANAFAIAGSARLIAGDGKPVDSAQQSKAPRKAVTRDSVSVDRPGLDAFTADGNFNATRTGRPRASIGSVGLLGRSGIKAEQLSLEALQIDVDTSEDDW